MKPNHLLLTLPNHQPISFRSEFVKKYGRTLGPRILRRIGLEKPESYREYGAGFFGAKSAKSRRYRGTQLFFHKLSPKMGLITSIMAGLLVFAVPSITLAQQNTAPPGVDLSNLDSKGKELFFRIAEEQFCPCGKNQSFKDSMFAPKDCEIATKLANFIAFQIADGVSRKDVVKALLKKIANINARFEFDLKQSPRLGPADAKIAVVVFSDFECPHCAKVSGPLTSAAKKNKDVALFYKFFPLSFHKFAQPAAAAALAAGRQGKFWEMHDALFDSQDSLSDEKIVALARKLKLDMTRFETDRKAQEVEKQIQADREEGNRIGLPGTPTIYVNGLMIDDVYDLEKTIQDARQL
ncbi:MAG: thioredoxin domain-containing protein [Myxococcales bacterium]|nr:thioredoxin domain-containing protein [Myxococcales bacterium]